MNKKKKPYFQKRRIQTIHKDRNPKQPQVPTWSPSALKYNLKIKLKLWDYCMCKPVVDITRVIRFSSNIHIYQSLKNKIFIPQERHAITNSGRFKKIKIPNKYNIMIIVTFSMQHDKRVVLDVILITPWQAISVLNNYYRRCFPCEATLHISQYIEIILTPRVMAQV